MVSDRVFSIIRPQSERSSRAARNIAISFVSKGISVIVGLLLVPMTINYVNPTQYGIWLTLSQIIGWVAFFDLGLGNGFRNRFAEAKADGNMLLARQYLSTTYLSVTCVVCILLIIIAVANQYVDWATILKVDPDYNEELRTVFLIISVFFCINMVASLFSTLLTADQKPGLSSIIYTIGQLFSLLSLFILTRNTEGSLVNLAVYYAGVPCLVMIVASIVFFSFTGYSELRPSFRFFRPKLIKDILGLGIQFFLIYICLIVIFQMINVIISREIGPDAVTEYNVAFRYFNVLYSVALIIITPFWTAFTDAYSKKDFKWMRNTLKGLEYCWIICLCVGFLMLALSDTLYRVWIGNSVSVSFTTSVGVMIFICVQTLGNIYMYIINGIGTIRIQLVIYVFFAVLSWPVMTIFCRNYGIIGVLVIPSAVYMIQAVMAKIQINKLISGTGYGWWIK